VSKQAKIFSDRRLGAIIVPPQLFDENLPMTKPGMARRDRTRLSRGARDVWIAMRSFDAQKSESECDAGLARVAASAGFKDARQVRTLIHKEMIVQGWVKLIEDRGGDGQTNRYMVTMPDWVWSAREAQGVVGTPGNNFRPHPRKSFPPKGSALSSSGLEDKQCVSLQGGAGGTHTPASPSTPPPNLWDQAAKLYEKHTKRKLEPDPGNQIALLEVYQAAGDDQAALEALRSWLVRADGWIKDHKYPLPHLAKHIGQYLPDKPKPPGPCQHTGHPKESRDRVQHKGELQLRIRTLCPNPRCGAVLKTEYEAIPKELRH
jgi:hypothetical protein